LIHRLGPLGADTESILKQLESESDLTIRRSLMLSLGEYDEERFPPDARYALLPKLEAIYRTENDPGLHAASEWLFRTWKREAWLKGVNEEWAKDKVRREKTLRACLIPGAKPHWYINAEGQTMVVIPGPIEFVMGSPMTEVGRMDSEHQHKRRINRTFAIAAKPVTDGEFQKYHQAVFKRVHDAERRYTQNEHCPVNYTTWHQAAAYCNWLSKKEGVDKGQWCYETNANGQVTRLKSNYLSLAGYRLPTEAETEYASRAGAVTSRCYGETQELLGKYAWYQVNSHEQLWPVGSLKPNDLGLFDVHGNVWTWCQELYKVYPKTDGITDDREDVLEIPDGLERVLRGGSFINTESFVRSAYRNYYVPSYRNDNAGFRVARTITP
jgi:formylglycine-generating enzyme required for sulfatase activity